MTAVRKLIHKSVKPKSQKKTIKKTAKKMKAVTPKPHLQLVKPESPLVKVHPFASFVKTGPSYRNLTPQMQRFANKDVYRKKAV